MKLGFSLLTLFGLTALVALELATLKTAHIAVFISTEIFVDCSLLVATWGAFLLTGKLRQFSMGFSVVGWAFILCSVFTNMDRSSYYESELAKLIAETIGLEVTLNTLGTDVIDPTGHYFHLWFLWSIFNFGLLGGLAALQLNTVGGPKISSAVDAVESPSE